MNLLIFAVIVLVIVLAFKNTKAGTLKSIKGIRNSHPDVDVSMYKKRYRLMNNSESSFFHVAKKSLPEGYFIFPKMRIADIIETKNGKGYYKQRNKILPKHVDFVVCDKELRTMCAIEIDGKSHNNPKKIERDELVEYIFESVGIPLVRVQVGGSFEKVCNEMRQYLEYKKSG